jgi:hypothetical protein
MEYRTPNKAGWYWAKWLSDTWAPREVIDHYEDGLSGYNSGFDEIFDLSEATWGPKIELPEGLV